ncbi:putative p60-like lipoprotein [Mycoplasmopsis columbina SF7]|uniref:Putative p60-like lipoprotein n=1 Tax=Mycoplasmopsis columbina SF7 TaxID=1037410 RepID=F9UKP3_9BACT|nr:hypothetical protein [Mycoplasmopsis columbina]EGV00248.1 putative p60-like lipoprotein [Mycoplasmopsis columbina SF7]
MKKLFKKFAVSSVISLPLLAVACGNVVDTPEKIKQTKALQEQAFIQSVETNWLEVTVASLYGYQKEENVKFSDYLNTQIDTKNPNLFNDAYNAFKIYAEEKLKNNPYYFVELNITLTKNANLSPQEASILNQQITSSDVPSKDAFKIYWKTTASNIRADVLKMLLVYKYFTLSDVESFKKIEDNFKFTASYMKYSNKNYFLNKYALSKRMVQIWQKASTSSISTDDFFLQGYGFITGPEAFNQFLKNTNEYNNTLASNSSQILTTNSLDTTLRGYSGFETNVNKYGLFWDYENLKKLTSPSSDSYSLNGYYDPKTNKLLTNVSETNAYSPFANDSDTTDKAIVVYLNQIVPIAELTPTNIPVGEDPKVTESVTLLSFENTPYKDALDKLSYIYYLKDSALYTTAQTAFAKLGYKLTLENIDDSLTKALKDKVFVSVKES